MAAGWPTAALPVSQTRIASARSRSAMVGDEGLESAGALLLRAFDDQLEIDRDVLAEGTQRREVHDDVALAVGGPAAVPAAVHLGQLERRRPPGVVVERRLDVVVGVEQDGGCLRIAAGPGPDDRHAAVRGLLEVGVGEADVGELLRDPLRRALALLGGELARIGHGSQGDELGELLACLGHQLRDTLAQDPCSGPRHVRRS